MLISVNKLEETHKQIEYINQEVIKKYCDIAVKILDETEDPKQILYMLTEKCFNRKEIIDIMSESDLQVILNNSKVERVVNDFWEGPYETQFFMNSSFAYSQVASMFIDSK